MFEGVFDKEKKLGADEEFEKEVEKIMDETAFIKAIGIYVGSDEEESKEDVKLYRNWIRSNNRYIEKLCVEIKELKWIIA